MPALHAELSASSSHRWLACPASIQASKAYQNKSSSAASYGTAAHALGEMVLRGIISTTSEMLGKIVEGILVDQEMVDGVQSYVDYILSYKGEYEYADVEVKLDFSHVVPDGWGTADCILVCGSTLHVIDLKFGYEYVDATENTQLQLYGIGAIKAYEAFTDIEEVVLHIVQPRIDNFSSWTTTPSDLEDWGKWVTERAQLALSDNPPYNPTKKGCQWCLHQHNCSALKDHVEGIIKNDFDNIEDIDGQADKISTDHIKRILDNMDLITGFLKAVQEVARERALSGEKIDGYKLVESRKNKAWVDEEAMLNLIKTKKLDLDKFAPRKLITPTQALKALGKKDESLIDNFWTTPKGEAVLVTSGDKRPEIGNICDEFEIVND